jgi:hypothetical protein
LVGMNRAVAHLGPGGSWGPRLGEGVQVKMHWVVGGVECAAAALSPASSG